MQGPGGSYKNPPHPWEMLWVEDGQELHQPVSGVKVKEVGLGTIDV